MNQAIMKPLVCANCGAPLDSAGVKGTISCTYCGQSHSFLQKPPPATGPLRLRAGDRVAVEWGGHWWAAQVIEPLGPAEYRIHYEGWSTRWDETVGPSRIRPRAAVNMSAGKSALRALLLVVALVGALLVAVTGVSLFVNARGGEPSAGQARGSFRAGQRVEIFWKGDWYPGQILSQEGQGRYRVTYDGYDSSWDEIVGSDRLRSTR